jgi:hypothetical protein
VQVFHGHTLTHTADIRLVFFQRRRWGKGTRNAAERLPSEVAKAGKESPSRELRQICIHRAMPADINHHAAKELEPLAIIHRQWPAAVALHVFPLECAVLPGASQRAGHAGQGWPQDARPGPDRHRNARPLPAESVDAPRGVVAPADPVTACLTGDGGSPM